MYFQYINFVRSLYFYYYLVLFLGVLNYPLVNNSFLTSKNQMGQLFWGYLSMYFRVYNYGFFSEKQQSRHYTCAEYWGWGPSGKNGPQFTPPGFPHGHLEPHNYRVSRRYCLKMKGVIFGCFYTFRPGWHSNTGSANDVILGRDYLFGQPMRIFLFFCSYLKQPLNSHTINNDLLSKVWVKF